MTRADGRAFDQLRPVELTKDYIKFAEGSVLIRCGDTVTRYPLTDERTIPLTHNGYTLSVTIANGAVSITASDCPDRVCVKTGEIAAVGSVIVCVPANVIVQIGGAEEADYVAG